MRFQCISCEREMNLDHEVFNDYRGPVKCFFCSAMMEMKSIQGVLLFVNLRKNA
jgi:hypothetical protein